MSSTTPSVDLDLLKLYMKQALHHPLLTRAEETALAKRIADGEKAKKKLGSAPSAQKKEWLADRIADGEKAKEQFVTCNLRLVWQMANRYDGQSDHHALLDLTGEGHLGLYKALNKFNYKRGCKFSTYATWWIRQTITRALDNDSRTIRLPVHIITRERRIRRAIKKIQQKKSDGQLSMTEIAQRTHLKKGEISFIINHVEPAVSLEYYMAKRKASHQKIADCLAQADRNPEEKAVTKMTAEKILTTLRNPREQAIIRARFGLGPDGQEYTLKQTGAMFSITIERVRQIEKEALSKLKSKARQMGLALA